ncbi:MAG: TadE/TadG family type IV pilus assembly protein [Phycisphaerae bacterium]
MMRHNVRRRSHERRGTAIVEMAIVTPLLMLLLLGIIEFGYVLLMHNHMINAAHQGAKKGITLVVADEEKMIDAVMEWIANADLGGLLTREDVTATVQVLDSNNTSVQVQVVLPYGRAAIFGRFLPEGFDLGSTCTMFR